MAGKDQYKAQQFIDAIPGTGGIISSVAKRVGCSWHTAKKYIEKYATVKRAYDDECEMPRDWAESVIIRNIALALKKQEQTNEPVDSSDAKWYLVHKGKDRGYIQRREITGAEGGPIKHEDVGLTDAQRIKNIAALLDTARERASGQDPDE